MPIQTYYLLLGLLLGGSWDLQAHPEYPTIAGIDILLCPADTVVSTSSGTCSRLVNNLAPQFLIDPAILDTFYYKIDNGQSGSGDASGVNFPLGTNTVTYIATSGLQTDSCSFTVSVEDQEIPLINCPQDVSIQIDGTIIDDPDHILLKALTDGQCEGITIFFSSPFGTDNCDTDLSLIQTNGLVPGSSFAPGIHHLSFLLVDDAGNGAVCEFTITVLPIEEIEISASPNTALCEGELVQLVPGTLSGFSYTWTGPNNFSNDEPSPAIYLSSETAGTYWVACTNSKGCTTIGSVTLELLPSPVISAISNSPVCDGQLNLSGINDSISPAIETWEWNGPCNFQSFTRETSIDDFTENCAGVYSLTATSFDGCQASTKTIVDYLDLPSLSIQTECDSSLCLGESCVLTGTDFNPKPEAYLWDSNDPEAGLPTISDAAKITITPGKEGRFTYTYAVVFEGCTTESVSFTLEVGNAPEAIDDEYQTASNIPLENIQPSDNDLFNPNLPFFIELIQLPENGWLKPQDDGKYSYQAKFGFSGTDQFTYQICNACEVEKCDEAKVSIKVLYEGVCFIPTIITPNGDQTNDELKIPCLESDAYPENSLIIFNQWGDKVFEAAPYKNDWDGTWQGKPGKPLPDGTYYFNFKRDAKSQVVKGHLLVYR